MALTDIQGRAYKLLAQTKAGDKVELDGGFTCAPKGAIRTIEYDVHHGLYFKCAAGRHHLHGQIDDADGTDALIGVYPASLASIWRAFGRKFIK